MSGLFCAAAGRTASGSSARVFVCACMHASIYVSECVRVCVCVYVCVSVCYRVRVDVGSTIRNERL